MKLQLCRAYGTLGATLPLAIVGLGLFGQMLSRHVGVFYELQAILRSESAMLLVCLFVWCGTLLFLTFSRRDWLLLTLLLVALAWYAIGHTESSRLMDAVILLAGVTLGKGMRFALKADGRWKMEDGENNSKIVNRESPIVNFLIGLIMLLAFAAWWHLEQTGAYRGPRWMGLWDNPNIYGMLMGAGLLLAVGLLAAKSRMEDSRWKMAMGINPPSPGYSATRTGSGKQIHLRSFAAVKSASLNLQSSILFVAAAMLGVGLVMSYSRGAWVATAIALLYLAWCYGKLKWRHVILGAGVLALGAGLFWGHTSDSAPWYVKRADLGRPSAQNRAIAWRAGLEIMRDHPLGVGWNNAVRIYGEKYSPPEGGPAALTTNDYLMLGTELGIPALLCFVAYLALCYRNGPRIHLTPRADQEFVRGTSSGLRALSPQGGEGHLPIGSADSADAEREKLSPQVTSLDTRHASLRAACLAGALVFVVAFWFDGGLFKLPTAALFWVLLELGASRVPKPKLTIARPAA